jgi:hypothetical protein
MFYYGDDEVAQVEMSSVVNGWNVGAQRAMASTVKILVMSEDSSLGHGSGNLFYYINELFVITSSHVVTGDNDHSYLIEEQDGNTLACEVIYNDFGNDIAILKPYGEFTATKPSPYLVNMQKDLRMKQLHYSGNPGELEHLSIRGWVADSDHHRVVMQSFGWPGSSGSVVFDSAGRVIGVVTAIPLANNFYEVLPRKTVRKVIMDEKKRIKSRDTSQR